MATTVNNSNIERLRKITFIICVPFYACTYKEKGTKRAEKGYQNRDKFFAEIVSILQADGWTLTTMGETLDCGKSTCPELTKGNEHIYCHPEELTGEVQDEKAFAEILKGAASFRIVKKEAGDIYVCADNEEGKQLYRDAYRDRIDEVIRDVVYLKTNIYGGRKGDWIDLGSATRIISDRIFIATKSNNNEYNSVTVLREYVTEELCRLQDAGRIEATTNKHGQTVIKWADERTLAYNTRCKELDAEALAQMPYKVGDTVKSRDGVAGRVIEMHPEITGDIDSPHLIYEYDGKPTVNVVILDTNGKRHCAHWSVFTLEPAPEIKAIDVLQVGTMVRMPGIIGGLRVEEIDRKGDRVICVDGCKERHTYKGLDYFTATAEEICIPEWLRICQYFYIGPKGVERNRLLCTDIIPCSDQEKPVVIVYSDHEGKERKIFLSPGLDSVNRTDRERLTAKYREQIANNMQLGCGCIVTDGDEDHKDSKCVKVRKAYTNDSNNSEDWMYCVAWYDMEPTEDGNGYREMIRECENGITIDQAAHHMAYFELMAAKGWTLNEILYGKAA